MVVMEMSIMQQLAVKNAQVAGVMATRPEVGFVRRSGNYQLLSKSASVGKISRIHMNSGSKGRRGTACASSGGSRRDDAKIVARTQKRRARHVKGVTPTKPDLFDELQKEEEADEQLERFEAIRGSESNAYTSDSSSDSSEEESEEASNVQASGDEPQKEVGDSAVEEFVKTGDDTYKIKYYPEGKKSEPGQEIRDSVEDAAEDVGEAAEEVGDVAQDTAEEVGATAQQAVEETQESLSETGDEVRETVEEGAEEVGSAAEEVADIAQDTAQDVAQTFEETRDEVGKTVDETADAVQDALEEVGSQGQQLAEEGQKQSEEIAEQADEAFEKISGEAEKSSQTVQASLSTVLDEASSAAETVTSEAFRLGEVVLSAAGVREESSPENGSGGQTKPKVTGSGPGQAVKEKPKSEAIESKNGYKPSGVNRNEEIPRKSSEPEQKTQEDKSLYEGLKVTVAGATGRTGKLLVEELVNKGVSVTALVRDKKKAEARYLARYANVEVVQVDLYKYETVKKALGDSNVVICAVGARSFPFDPIGTYQAEFEGVRNLVAAAKNKGDVKKFVFITSLGVTWLQIIPLIFWKRQSELYLQRSGLDYTIVRPGGLTNETDKKKVLFKAADTQFGGSISRKKVAEVCVAALITPESSEKIVEVVSGSGESRNFADLFASV